MVDGTSEVNSPFTHPGCVSSTSGNDQRRPLKYYCMNCGKEHKEIACPNCGSKAKKVG